MYEHITKPILVMNSWSNKEQVLELFVITDFINNWYLLYFSEV